MTNNVEELIVLGNGFDLQCGLKTTYENFFRTTLSNLEEYKDETQDPIEYFENNISECLRFKSLDFEMTVISGSNFSKIPKNIWYQLFLKEKNNKNVLWSDIEKVLFDYLHNKKIINVLSELFIKYKDVGMLKVARENMSIETILLMTIFNKTKDNKKIYEEIKNKTATNIHEYIAYILQTELQELENDFLSFVKGRLSKEKNYVYRANDLLVREIICGNNVSKLPQDGVLPCNVVTFNYTCPFKETAYEVMGDFNVHGKITLSEENSVAIFGINHDVVPADSLEFRFTKNYRTLSLYSINPEYEDYKNMYTDEIKKIKFYGHSLAEADYAYFQQMFDHYKLYSNNDLQLIFYYSVYDENREQEIRQEQFNNISRLISTYGATLDNKAQGNNLLTRLTQTGRLRLVKI